MAIHGANRLANDDSLDSQWRYVRQNLDGLWGNTANVSEDEQARLFEKVAKRTVITEVGMSEDKESWGPVANYDRIEAKNPELKIDREAIAFYTNDPSRWDGRSVAAARAEFVTNPKTPERQRYGHIYTGWQPWNFSRTPMTPSAEAAIDDATGMFVECPRNTCATKNEPGTGLREAIQRAHAADEPFVWFAANGGKSQPTSGWLADFQETYNALRAEGLWRENDIVMVINYHGDYPSVPETANGEAADTVTGLAYWALQQDW
ncbi:MAG: hypothetical protein ACRCXL_15655 [Dermatophilaceae bacterium]